MIIELIEVVFSSILSLISPEKTADKVKDIDTSKSAKSMLIILFTLIYGATLIGIAFSIVHTTEVLYRRRGIYEQEKGNYKFCCLFITNSVRKHIMEFVT